MNSLCLLKFIVIPKSVWAIVENFSCPVGMFPDEVEQRLTGANSHSNQCHFCGLGRGMFFPFLCGFFELFVYWCFFFLFLLNRPLSHLVLRSSLVFRLWGALWRCSRSGLSCGSTGLSTISQSWPKISCPCQKYTSNKDTYWSVHRSVMTGS